jgi:hypothetical protein
MVAPTAPLTCSLRLSHNEKRGDGCEMALTAWPQAALAAFLSLLSSSCNFLGELGNAFKRYFPIRRFLWLVQTQFAGGSITIRPPAVGLKVNSRILWRTRHSLGTSRSRRAVKNAVPDLSHAATSGGPEHLADEPISASSAAPGPLHVGNSRRFCAVSRCVQGSRAREGEPVVVQGIARSCCPWKGRCRSMVLTWY